MGSPNRNLPNDRRPVAQTFLNIPVQHIVAHVCHSTLHPLNLDGSLSGVEIKLKKVRFRSTFEIELFTHFTPERFGIFDALQVHLFVRLHALDVGRLPELLVRVVDRRVGLLFVGDRHFAAVTAAVVRGPRRWLGEYSQKDGF